MRNAIIMGALLTLTACGSAETSGSGAGGSGGATTTTSTTSQGGTGGVTDTGGTTTTNTETACVPGTSACEEWPQYPDPLLAFDPAQNVVSAVYPAGDESPTGAATALLGPWPTNKTIKALRFVVQQAPTTIAVAVLLEAACGVPPQDHDPNVGAVTVDGSLITSEPFGAIGSILITVPLPVTVFVPAGTPVYVSRILTEPSAHVDAITPSGKVALRSYWWGEVDNDCDKKKDPTLGWAALAHPTAPGIGKYNYDLGMGVVTQ